RLTSVQARDEQAPYAAAADGDRQHDAAGALQDALLPHRSPERPDRLVRAERHPLRSERAAGLDADRVREACIAAVVFYPVDERERQIGRIVLEAGERALPSVLFARRPRGDLPEPRDRAAAA